MLCSAINAEIASPSSGYTYNTLILSDLVQDNADGSCSFKSGNSLQYFGMTGTGTEFRCKNQENAGVIQQSAMKCSQSTMDCKTSSDFECVQCTQVYTSTSATDFKLGSVSGSCGCVPNAAYSAGSPETVCNDDRSCTKYAILNSNDICQCLSGYIPTFDNTATQRERCQSVSKQK